jgi:uncharacterized membrane protein (UPF0127 family)
VAGCAGPTTTGDPTTTSGRATTSGPATTSGSGFATSTIEVASTELTVWVADTPSRRAQGLRQVEVLPDGVDGMLFVWNTPTSAVFGMADTLIPLDLWWFGPHGELLGVTEMQTCPDGDCVSYGSPGAVGWALETPAGAYEFPPGAELTTSGSG